jgi:DNA-binding transcriptional ArsR family regulator
MQKARERSPGVINPKVAIIAKDPLRAEIVAVAIQRLYAPSEFAKDADIGVRTASYHFKVLKDHSIIELVKKVKVGGAVKHLYRANEAAFIDDREWGALAQVLRPGVAGTTFENFNARVIQAAETGTLFARENACIYWTPRDFDEIAWLEHVSMIKWAIEESDRLEAETVERRANGESSDSFKATFGIFSFVSPTHSEVKAQEQVKRKEEREAAQAKGKRKWSKGQSKAKAKDKAKATAKGKARGRGKGKERKA